MLGAIAGASLVFAAAQTILFPVLPEVQKDFGVSAPTAAWLVTSFLVAAAIGTPIFGRLGDVLGKRAFLHVCLGLNLVGPLLAALGGDFASFLTGRVLQGLGAAVVPLAIGIARDELEPPAVASGIGIVSAMFGVGGGIGLLVSGVLTERWGLAGPLWAEVALGVLALATAWRWVPRSDVRGEGGVDWLGAVLLSIVLAAALIAISEGESWGWGSAGILALIAITFFVGAAWWTWERRVTTPLVDLSLLSGRAMWAPNSVTAIVGFTIFGIYVLVPQFAGAPTAAGYGFGVSLAVSGLFLIPSNTCIGLAGFASGHVSRRIGTRTTATAGGAAMAVAVVVLIAVRGSSVGLCAATALFGCGIGLILSASAVLVVDAAPSSQTGVVVGLNSIIRLAGGAVGVQAMSVLLSAGADSGAPAEHAFVTAFAVCGAGALAAVAMTRAVPRT